MVLGETMMAGVDDSFAGDSEITLPSPALVNLLNEFQGHQDFDLIPGVNGGRRDRQVAHTFTGIPSNAVNVFLELRAAAGNVPGTDTDGVFLSFADETIPTYADAIIYRRSFGPLLAHQPYYPHDDPGLVSTWYFGDEAVVKLDIAALPVGDGTTLNLLPTVTTKGFIDVNVSDDTGVDYMLLSYSLLEPTGVEAYDVRELALSASPNPFTSRTSIQFALPAAGEATIRVYEITGRLVRTIHRTGLSGGAHSIAWDGRDELGQNVAAGVYLYRLESGRVSETHQVVRIR
jgi:hypothetical protein